MTDGATTEVGGGIYSYTLASGSTGTEGEYVAVFKTADGTVDQKQIPALWVIGRAGVEDLDATISSRSNHTAADSATAVWGAGTRTLTSFGTLVADVATAVWGAAARTLTSFGTLATDVWAAATRTLTSGANIALAKGTGVTGFTDLDAAGVRSAVGLASANLDTQLGSFSAGAVADAVWDEALTGHAGAGSAGAALSAAGGAGGTDAASVWAYAQRTLTQSAAQVQAAVTGSDIAIRRGDTVVIALTGLGSIAARTKLWFGLKEHLADADGESVALVEETDGLTVLCGAVYETAADGEIVVDDEAAGNITITLAAAVTAQMTPRHGLDYDVQMLTASGVRTLTAGRASVLADVTRALS